jgi:hypothetical protein
MTIRLNAQQLAEVTDAGNSAVLRYNTRSIFSICARPVGLTAAQQTAADEVIRSCEAKGSKLNNVVRKSDGRDKILKFFLGALGLVNYGLEKGEASLSTREGFSKFTMSVRDARTIFAIMNIFGGVLQTIIDTFKSLYDALSHLIRGDATEVKVRNVTTGADSVFSGTAQHVAGLFSMVGQLTANLTFTVCFGLCSPIKCIDSHWKLGESACSIGNQFSFLMMINHLAEIVHCIGDFVHLGLIYNRPAQGQEVQNDESKFRKFWQNLVKIIACALEKTFEFLSDLFTVFKIQGPPLVKLIFTFSANCIGLWRTFNNADIEMEDAIRKKPREDLERLLNS